MAEEKTNKALDDITGIVDNMGKIVTNANTIFAQLAESLSKTGVSFDTLSSDMAGVMPNILGIIAGYESVKGAVGIVTGGIGNAIGAVDKIGKGMMKIPEIFSGIGDKIGLLGSSFSDFTKVLIKPIQDFAPKVIETANKIGSTVSSIGEKVGAFGGKVLSKFQGLTGKLGEIGSYLGKWGTEVGSSFSVVLDKAASFGMGFLKLMGIGAGIGLVVAGLGLLHQAYGDEIDGLLEMMMTKGPEIITNLCNGIVEALPALMEQGALLLNSLMLAITANLPALLAGGFSILSGLIEGIAAQLPMLVPTAITLILTLIQGLLDNIPQLISSGLTLLMGLAQGLINAIPILIAMAPGIIQSLLTGILTMIPQIIQTGIVLIGQLAIGLVEAIPKIIDAIPQIIDSIKSSFSSVDWGAVGHDIIEGIKNGIGKAASMLLDMVVDVGHKAFNAIRDLFKINSPSRVFRDKIGKMMALGMGIGFESNVPLGEMKKGLGQALKTLEGQASVAMSTFGGGISYQNSILSGGSAMQGFDFDEFERRQRKINNERTDRPVFLNGRQVNRALKKGVPVTV